MANSNLVIRAGRIGSFKKGGELFDNPNDAMHQLPGGAKVLTFTMAVSGIREGETDWTDVTCFRNSAEKLAKHFKKGDAIFVIGKLSSRRYESKDGKTRTAVEVQVGHPGSKIDFCQGGNVNKVMFAGFLPQELKLSDVNGTPVLNTSIGTKEFYYKEGESKPTELVTYMPLTVWDKEAKAMAEYLVKGSEVLVEGRLRTRKYKDGDADVYITEIVASRVDFLSTRASDEAQPGQDIPEQPAPEEKPAGDPAEAEVAGGSEDDVPF